MFQVYAVLPVQDSVCDVQVVLHKMLADKPQNKILVDFCVDLNGVYTISVETGVRKQYNEHLQLHVCESCFLFSGTPH